MPDIIQITFEKSSHTKFIANFKSRDRAFDQYLEFCSIMFIVIMLLLFFVYRLCFFSKNIFWGKDAIRRKVRKSCLMSISFCEW